MIFKQTFKNFETIIVDSGSTDGAIETINKFPVKLVHTNQPDPSNFNHARAFNEGATVSKGQYLVRLSGDAIPADKNWLKNIIVGIEKKDVAGICGSYIFSTRADLLFQFWFRTFFKFTRSGKPTSFTGGNCVIKKNLWEKYPFDEKWGLGEDYAWGAIMQTKGFKILFNTDAAVFHEHRSGIKKQIKNIWWFITENIPKNIILAIKNKLTNNHNKFLNDIMVFK